MVIIHKVYKHIVSLKCHLRRETRNHRPLLTDFLKDRIIVMSINDLLEIPEFLQREPKPVSNELVQDKPTDWWMPDLQAYKEERLAKEKRKQEIEQEKTDRAERKARKKRIEHQVYDAVSRKQNTFGMIRKVMLDNISDSEIRGAIRRLTKQNLLDKISKRVYTTR